MRYPFIKQYEGQFSVAALCRVMEVTRSGYYAWRNQEQELGQRQRADALVLPRIRAFFEQSKQTYGSPRIVRDLKAEGLCCGKHRVARLMRQTGLLAVAARRFQVTTDTFTYL